MLFMYSCGKQKKPLYFICRIELYKNNNGGKRLAVVSTKHGDTYYFLPGLSIYLSSNEH